jgi:hypothetical protein
MARRPILLVGRVKEMRVGPNNLFLVSLGKGLANPTALLLSSLMMLRHMNLNEHADRIGKATLSVCVYIFVDEYPLTLTGCVVDDRGGKNYHWGSGGQGLHERVHSCHC